MEKDENEKEKDIVYERTLELKKMLEELKKSQKKHKEEEREIDIRSFM